MIKKLIIVLICTYAFVATSFSGEGTINAISNNKTNYNALHWIAPDVLEGEPNLTGFTIYWSTNDVAIDSTVYQHFDFSETNAMTNAELVVNGMTNFYTATNYPSGATNIYSWTEYPLDTPTNTVVKKWFWVTASNETGAVSDFSDSCTITLDLLKTGRVQDFERK